MKIEELTALGIPEEAAKKVLDLSEAELTAEQKKTTETENKLTAANTTITDLTAKVQAFDGVDVDGLKKSAADWEQKYNADLAAVKTASAIDLELVKAGAKDNRLVRALLDESIIKLDDKGQLVGLSEQLATIQKDRDYLFHTQNAEGDTGMTGSTGSEHGEPPQDADKFEKAAREAAGLAAEN